MLRKIILGIRYMVLLPQTQLKIVQKKSLNEQFTILVPPTQLENVQMSREKYQVLLLLT